MKKSRMTIALALLLALTLSGCGGSAAKENTDNTGIGTQSTDDTAALPDTTESRPVGDAPMMIMVDHTLYQSNGEVSTVEDLFCNRGVEIATQTANGADAPTEDDQSNFGTGYGYQFGDGTVEVLIDNQWIVFRPITDSDV